MGKKRLLSKKERAELDNERLKKILKDRNKINLAEQQLKRDKLNKQKENEAKKIEIENQRQIDKVLKLKEKEILRLEKVKIDSLPENIEKKRLKKNEKRRSWTKNQKLTNPLFKLTKNIRRLIGVSLKRKNFKKTSKTSEMLGCSFKEFQNHIESQFEPWMNWNNYGKHKGKMFEYWSLDHIIPLATAKTKEDVIQLNHYTNLQPLCSYINEVIKKDRIDFDRSKYKF